MVVGVTVAECSVSLSLGGLCSPDLSIYHRERKSVALWSEQCEIPSGFQPSLTPLACAHARSFLSAFSLSRSLAAPLILYLWFSRTLSFLLQSLTGPLARSVMLLQWPWKINPFGELSTGVRSFWHLLPIGSAQINGNLIGTCIWYARCSLSSPIFWPVPLRADGPPEHLAAFC